MELSQKFLWIWLVAVGLVPNVSFSEPTHGYEITLSGDGIAANSHPVRELQLLYDGLRDPAVQTRLGISLRVTSGPNQDLEFETAIHRGPTLRWTTDYGVVEIKLGPITLEQLQTHREAIQRIAFDFPARTELHLRPHRARGGGHEHVGVRESFGNDATHFRNYIVYLLNHPEITTFIRGSDSLPRTDWDTLVMAGASPVQKEAIRRVIDGFDRMPLWQRTIGDLSRNLWKVLLETSDDARAREYDVNVQAVDIHGTVEMRGGAPFRSASEMVLRAQLREAILAHTAGEALIPLAIPSRIPTPLEAVGQMERALTDLSLPLHPFTALIHLPRGDQRGPCVESLQRLGGAAAGLAL